MTHRIAEAATGTGAAAVTATNPAEYSDVLTHAFFWGINYAEWFKILAAILVAILIIKNISHFFGWAVNKLK